VLLFRPMIPLSTIGQNRLGPPEERLSRVPMAKGTWRSELVFFKSGLRERLRPSRSVRSPQGQQSRNRETMALEGNDLGIDGVGRDSIAKCTAVDCPTQYSRSRTFTGRSAGGKACVRHFPIWRLCVFAWTAKPSPEAAINLRMATMEVEQIGNLTYNLFIADGGRTGPVLPGRDGDRIRIRARSAVP